MTDSSSRAFPSSTGARPEGAGSAPRCAPPHLRFVLAPFLVALAACAEAPFDPSQPPPTLSAAEVERRVEAARSLARMGDEERALSSLELAPGESLDSPGRREFARTAQEIRRSRFWRDAPLRTALTLRSERIRYGETVAVVLSLTNLGPVELTLIASHRTLADLLTWSAGERAVIALSVERRECDAVGTRIIERQNHSIVLEDDLTIDPGDTIELVASLPIEPRRGALFGSFAVEAVLRPIAIDAGGERRYDPLRFGRATLDVVRKEVEPWFDAGLNGVEAEVRVGAEGRPEALLLAIAGLQTEDLRGGLDQVVRALPNLDPARRRLAHGALEWCLGNDVPNDPVAIVAWWDAEGVHIDPADLRAMRYGRRAPASRWFAGGIDPSDDDGMPMRDPSPRGALP